MPTITWTTAPRDESSISNIRSFLQPGLITLRLCPVSMAVVGMPRVSRPLPIHPPVLHEVSVLRLLLPLPRPDLFPIYIKGRILRCRLHLLRPMQPSHPLSTLVFWNSRLLQRRRARSLCRM